MRALLAALILIAAPLASAAPAFADGIERPRERPRQRPRPAPVPLMGAPEAPRPAPVDDRYVTLSDGFFTGSAGGVGADIGGDSYSSVTVIVRGGASARASAFASARASASARGGAKSGGCACR